MFEHHDFQSSALQGFLKRAINNSVYYHYRLRMLANCGTMSDPRHGVQVVSNGYATRFIGAKLCHHSWACPYCTAREMSHHSQRIGAAMDALAKQGLTAIMITMTLFHTVRQTCEESYDILRHAWMIFDKNKVWKRKHSNGKTYSKCGAWNTFNNDMKATHRVKTLEITYGQHGWHPHIHMLVWIPKKKLQKVADYERDLINQWKDCVDKAAKKILSPERYEYRKFYEAKYELSDNDHEGLFISKNANGKIRAWSSADYICDISAKKGWGGNTEVTGLHNKEARNGNMTPFQMLEKAYELHHTDPCLSNRLLELYLHFAWVCISRRLHRIDYSRTGLKAIIDNWMKGHEFKSAIKKKSSDICKSRYHNVAWFTSKQWSDICYKNDVEGHYWIIPLITQFAKYEDDPIFGVGAFDLICELLIVNNLPPPVFVRHPTIDFADLFNKMTFHEDEQIA